MGNKRGLTVMVVPEGGGRRTRTLEVPSWAVRTILLGGLAFVLLLAGLVGSWWYLAARAQKATELERELARVYVDRERLDELAGALDEVEGEYERLRALFSPEGGGSGPLWLPAASGRRLADEGPVPEGETVPTSWPLTERGVVTRSLLEGVPEGHTGLDIAVPTGSYIRAAGAGVVVEEGFDSVYGLFVVLDHGDGYRTRYAHASLVLVGEGDRVRRNEVIALSGSTGRSSAPHLHFEILKDGDPIDPLSMVARP